MLQELDQEDLFKDRSTVYDSALIDLSSGSAVYYTYKDIEDHINYFACGLEKLALPIGSRVAVVANNSFKFIVCYLGSRRAGLVPVLVNYKLSTLQIRTILEHSDSQHVFYDAEYFDKIPLAIRKTNLDTEYDEFIVNQQFTADLQDLTRPAFFLYTSGSTGEPKGVVVTTKSRQWLIKSLRGPRVVRALVAAPMYHMNGLSNVESRLRDRAPIVLLPKFDAISFIKAISNHRVSVITAVPPMMAMLLQQSNMIDTLKNSSVRTIMLASAPTSTHLYNRIQAAFPKATIMIRYGLTEVGPSLFGPHPDKIETPFMSVGYPRPKIEYKLIDNVLYIKSPSMLTQYHKNQDRYNDAVTADGFFNTKDKFRVDEQGFYYFVGRSDDMFVSGGENIFPAEVQDVLESHTNVREAVVIGLEDEIKGTKPYAFVVRNAESLNEDALKEYFLNNAPAYQLPRKIWFVDSLPVTGTNKIDTKALETVALENLKGIEDVI